MSWFVFCFLLSEHAGEVEAVRKAESVNTQLDDEIHDVQDTGEQSAVGYDISWMRNVRWVGTRGMPELQIEHRLASLRSQYLRFFRGGRALPA